MIPIHDSDLFLYPLKTSKTLWFSDIERDRGMKWVRRKSLVCFVVSFGKFIEFPKILQWNAFSKLFVCCLRDEIILAAPFNVLDKHFELNHSSQEPVFCHPWENESEYYRWKIRGKKFLHNNYSLKRRIRLKIKV